jgi:hypothetical protein
MFTKLTKAHQFIFNFLLVVLVCISAYHIYNYFKHKEGLTDNGVVDSENITVDDVNEEDTTEEDTTEDSKIVKPAYKQRGSSTILPTPAISSVGPSMRGEPISLEPVEEPFTEGEKSKSKSNKVKTYDF